MNQRDEAPRTRGGDRRAELTFQADRASVHEITPTPQHVFQRYARMRWWRLVPNEALFRALGDLRGKQVLDFGCGEGMISTQLAWLGAEVTGVDLSPELIELAERRATMDGVSERTEFLAGDIMELEESPNRFDALVCSAVLHHVDLETVFPHLLGLVRDGGIVVLSEPIAFSTGLQAMRDRVPVPKDVSPEERQLSREEVEFLAAQLKDVRITYFRLTARLTRLLKNANRIDRGHPFTKTAVLGLGALDRVALTLVPPLRGFAGIVVLRGVKRDGQPPPGAPIDPS